MIPALVALPAMAGALAFLLPWVAARRALLPAAALAHAGLTAAAWRSRPAPALGGWLALDAPGLVFLTIASALFAAAALYAPGYLRREGTGSRRDFEEGAFFADAPERVFIGCLLLFLAAMTLVTVSQHMGLLWVAVEGTTLASAPLIYFHRHHRSLEATWKYLLLCSVGIALALLGTFFLAVAVSRPEGGDTPLVLADLVEAARAGADPAWLRVAVVFLIVGYGTKTGLAPLHTWLPDAHSESPSLVSALLSGALLNCAFLGILRTLQVASAGGAGGFTAGLLVGFGLASMIVAAGLILGQADYKRLLAYSSIEHMGIVSLGIGLGGAAGFGAMLHAVNHSLAKASMFLVAGNILARFRTKSTAEVRGVLGAMPVSGALWVAGFLALTGMPPFGPFLSEMLILKGAFDAGRPWVAAGYAALLALVFIGMSAVVLRMAQPGEDGAQEGFLREEASTVLPSLALMGIVLLLGLFVPAALGETLQAAARAVGHAP
ncbi:MAG TPA: proton-conducting transporter membrane subunit [Candidatus Polarisedimenticolia bacterium]|nr:proton-conducting transporter membrane subunit [Candidatus Polarisedimenticolia bacterium]